MVGKHAGLLAEFCVCAAFLSKDARCVLTCEVPYYRNIIYGNKASTKFSIKIIHKNAKLPSILYSLLFGLAALVRSFELDVRK